MMFLPIPIAIVCSVAQDDDLKKFTLTELQQSVLAELKKAGYKRTKVEEDDEVIIGTSVIVTLVSPDNKMTFRLELNTTYTNIHWETSLSGTKSAMMALFGPLMNEKFPTLEMDIWNGVVGAKLSLSKEIGHKAATPAWALATLDELKKAAALVESNKPATDPTVERLKEAKLVYSDIGSFYKLKYDYTDNKRSQVAYIRKEIYTYNSLKVQEIFSLCYDKPEPPSAELLQSAFQKRYTIGGLVLEAPSEKQANWRIRFRASVATNVLPQTLKEYMLLVAGTADNLEKELNPNQEDKL